jgi:hypothetical protein
VSASFSVFFPAAVVCDSLAALSCVALFHAAGWGMVLLLISDCALLACDVIQHILKHFSSVLEAVHSDAIQEIEARQLELHNLSPEGAIGSSYMEDGSNDWEILSSEDNIESSDIGTNVDEDMTRGHGGEGQQRARQELRLLDRQLETMEMRHKRKVTFIDGVIFAFDITLAFVQVFHFLHLWVLHGMKLSLIGK